MRQNRHCLVKLWKCQGAMSIFPHEAKALLQLFCLQPIIFGWRQNSFSGAFASWGKIKIHYFIWADQHWIGLMIFKNFAVQYWIRFNFIGSGLDSNSKISQSTHLWGKLFSEAGWFLHHHVHVAMRRLHFQIFRLCVVYEVRVRGFYFPYMHHILLHK